MTKFLWSFIKTAPVVVGASILAIQGASAATETVTEKLTFQSSDKLIAQALTNGSTTNNSTQQMLGQRGRLNRMDGQLNEKKSESLDQITSVSELRDVEPTAWAYEALRSLVERYGCIVGYPDSTFRGNRALSRWEFAAGVNACLNTIERLIQENVAVLKEDVDTLKRLAQEFEAELAALGGRVDNLEARTSFLEDHQFSTTTKLRGEVIFSVADTFGDFADGRDEDDPNVTNGLVGDRTDDPTQTVFQSRVRLNFETSFTGEDLLRTRLQAGNFEGNRFDSATTGTNMTRLAFDDGENMDVTINDLWYRFPIGESLTVWAGPSGLDLDDVFSTVNPYLADSGVGSLTRYARYNNMVNRGPSGAGAGAKFEIGDKFYVSAAYLAEDDGDAPDPSEGNGLFNGSFSTGGQVGFLPTEDIEIAATYVYSYRTGFEGLDDEGDPIRGRGLFDGISSNDAEFPFGRDIATTAHRIGLSASWKITDIIHIGAYGGYATADAQIPENVDLGGADIWTWNANVSILDLGKEGAVLSLSGGLPPKGEYIIDDNNDIRNGFRRVDDQSYIIQAQYKFPINDNIFITPGAYVVLNPNHDNSNDPLWVGIIRTTFRF